MGGSVVDHGLLEMKEMGTNDLNFQTRKLNCERTSDFLMVPVAFVAELCLRLMTLIRN